MEADESDLPPVHFTHQAHMDRMIYGTSFSDQQGRRVHPMDVFGDAPAFGRRSGKSFAVARAERTRQERCQQAIDSMLERRGLRALGLGLVGGAS